MAVGPALVYDMSNESKEEAEVIPEVGEASFAFLTSFSDLEFQSDELDFLSSEPGTAEANREPISPKKPALSPRKLKDRVKTLKAEKKQRQPLSPMRKSMAISNHGDETKTPRSNSGGSLHGSSLHGSSLHGSVHNSSSMQSLDTSNSKTPLHFRKSIASESAARRIRRQALRDSLEANSQAVSEMELPAPDLMRSPTEQTMYLKSPTVKKQKLQRVSTANGSLGSHSYHGSNHSTALSLDSVDEVFKKSKKKKKHRKSECLPKTTPLNDDDDDDGDEFACDNVSKKSSKSSKSKRSKRTGSMEKKKKKKNGEKKEKKKRSSSIKRAPPSREPVESKEEPTAAPATTPPDANQGNGTEQNPMEFSKFEFSEACFDVDMYKSKELTIPDLEKSETDVTKETSATTQDTIRESSKQLGEEEIVELKTEESTENIKVIEKRPRLSASKERKPKGSPSKMEEESEELGEEDLKDQKTQSDAVSEKKKKRRSASASRERRLRGRVRKQEEESAELDEEGSDTLNDGPSETGEKKKRRSVSASKERKLRGRLQRKLSSSKNVEKEEDVDENQQNDDKKKRRSASTSKERTLRDRFRRRGSQTAAAEGEGQPQEKRRSASASSLRDRFRKRQTSRESLASAQSAQQEPLVPPMSPPQRASTYSYSFDSPRAEQVPDSPMSAGWAKKRRGRQSFFSSPTGARSGGQSRGFRSGGRRASMTGGAPLSAPLNSPPQQVSRTGVIVSPGRLKSRPSVASLFSETQQNGSFRSQRTSNTKSSKKSTSDAFDPFAEPKANKLNESLHDTPKGRKSGIGRRRAEQWPAPPSRGGRRPSNNFGGGIRAQSPVPDLKGRYQSPVPDLKGRYASPGPYRAPASPVTRRRGPVSVPMSAPAAVKRPVRMRRSQMGDIGSILREDSEGTLNNPRRSRSLKRNTINHRGNGRRSAESVDRRNNVNDAMSQLIDGCTSHHRTIP